MESISSILPFVSQGMWATSLDVTDAFWSISIRPSFQPYLCFVLDGIVFMFLKLPFGLTSAPWAFSRLMRPIKKHLRSLKVHVSAFLDDFMIAALYRDLCLVHTNWAADLLSWLGFSINEKKSERVPRQSIVYLGVLINLHTLTIALPPEQVANISARCNKLLNSTFIVSMCWGPHLLDPALAVRQDAPPTTEGPQLVSRDGAWDIVLPSCECYIPTNYSLHGTSVSSIRSTGG